MPKLLKFPVLRVARESVKKIPEKIPFFVFFLYLLNIICARSGEIGGVLYTYILIHNSRGDFCQNFRKLAGL